MNTVFDTSLYNSNLGPDPFLVSGAGQLFGAPDVTAWATKTVEKIRAAVVGGLRFLPRLDAYSEETPEIRAAYRLMLREPVLKASNRSKVSAVASLPWMVTPTSDDDRDVTIARFVKHCGKRVKGGTIGIARSIAKGGLIDGFSVSNKVMMTENVGEFSGKLIWKYFKPKDTERLTLSQDQFRNITAVRSTSFGIGEAYDPSSFAIYSHDSLFESALGTSDHRACFGPFWFKDVIKKLWGLHLDKYVSPMLKGTYSTIPQKEALELALEQARSNTWMTIPSGVLVEAVQMATRGEAEFEAACRYQDEQMLLATEGGSLQRLQGQVPDGRGDTSVHKAGQTSNEWDLAADVQQVINEQLVPELIELNYAGADCPEVTLGAVSDSEMADSLKIDKGLQEMGYRHSRKRMSKSYSREEATDDADLLAPAGQPLSEPQPQPFAVPGQPATPGAPTTPGNLAVAVPGLDGANLFFEKGDGSINGAEFFRGRRKLLWELR